MNCDSCGNTMLLKEGLLAARGVRPTDYRRGFNKGKATAAARRATKAALDPLHLSNDIRLILSMVCSVAVQKSDMQGSGDTWRASGNC